MVILKRITLIIALTCVIPILHSCKKIKELRDNNPDLRVLQQGFRAGVTIGYCASLANMAFKGEELPSNVTFSEGSNNEYSSSGLIYIDVTANDPLPAVNNAGKIVIAALWDATQKSGVMSILFADIDLLAADFKFYGLYTVPFAEEKNTGKVISVFAEQDIVIGEGQDTLINLSLTRPKFDTEINRTNDIPPTDAFLAAQQNVWFIKVNQNNTFPNVYDDTYEITGGGQIAEVRNDQGGIEYHALIDARYNYEQCRLNPIDGQGYIQNIKAGSSVDLGHITLNFHSDCDGQARASFALGQKYIQYNGRDVNLNF
ncbi:MAG TPA: hypothetical protein PKL31_02225 [Fulvivirga sp.]|nr:hypothetical protein [Fulvivirga sp.]